MIAKDDLSFRYLGQAKTICFRAEWKHCLAVAEAPSRNPRWRPSEQRSIGHVVGAGERILLEGEGEYFRWIF